MFDIEKVFEIVCGINAISNYAYDIHYSAKGKFFYSDHLFSERIGDTDDMSDEKDDLIETVYLGRGIDAPLSSDIAARVAEITPEVTGDTQTNFKSLRDMIVKVLVDIEALDDLTRGEEDLLGTIAHILQRHNGLLFRQLSYTLEELQNSDDDFDWVTVKGNHIPVPKGASEEEKSKAIEQFFKDRGGQSRNFIAKKVDSKTFYNNMKMAKNLLAPKDKWRVDLHSEDDYNNSKLYSTKGGSCVAIEKDGNIISVCRNPKAEGDKGSYLLQTAIANGGKKLDAFGRGLYNFYTKNGFEPVSWVAFDENYAPEGWDKNRDEPEPIIFYKHTGNVVSDSYDDFLKKVKESNSYDDAFNVRDKSIRG